MGWYTNYQLLQKYNGHYCAIPDDEKRAADRTNPNSPSAAWDLALKKYKEDYCPCGGAEKVNDDLCQTCTDLSDQENAKLSGKVRKL